jgi:hypothetical protein
VQVGDIVRHFLTEQIGIVMTVVSNRRDFVSVRVLWTTKGESLFGPGNKEWCSPESLTLLTTA